MIYKKQNADQIIRLELELTSTCNLKCPLCIRSIIGAPDKNQYRDITEIISQLDGYPNLKYVTIAGAISEPTSYPYLFDVIVYLKKRGIEISLYINGDTRNDLYYRKLGMLFRNSPGAIYFTICGSTQALHERYRVNSSLDRVLKNLELINRYGNCGILTWIVFNYNEDDFLKHYDEFKAKYNTEFFYTLPMAEHFQIQSDVRLPDRLSSIYNAQIDRNDFTVSECPAVKNGFVQINHDGAVHPCTLHRLYGETHCFECSKKNLTILRNNKIFNVAEPESENSEEPLRLYYDKN